jgi:rRNA maturation endonuclease Nob1
LPELKSGIEKQERISGDVMYKYRCPKCEGEQYSSSSDKGNELCIYCGHDGVSLVNEKILPKKFNKLNKGVQEHDFTRR